MITRCLAPIVFWFLWMPLASSAQEEPSRVRNVILMVADGAGYNTWAATSMYQGRWNGARPSHAGQVYGRAGWVQVGKACWSLRAGAEPFGDEVNPRRRYDPEAAWDDAAESGARDGYAHHFRGYRWHKEVAPDSAATMTHMMTGQKTYNGAVNVDTHGDPIEATLTRLAVDSGRRVGVVTSVPWSHATPAVAADAHHRSRGAYEEIAQEILGSDAVHVLFGGGHPEFDNAGQPRTPGPRDFRYVGGADEWALLKNGEHPGGWTLVEDGASFAALAAAGRLLDGSIPERCLGTAPVAQTLQQGRPHTSSDAAPFTVPMTPTVPALATLTQGALRLLERHPDGFFLMVEGGAVDWAMHANQSGHMIEEMVAFNEAVETVVEWIEGHGGFDNTLLLLTADHDHLLYGPGAGEEAFQAVTDRGPGQLPGTSWHWNSHSNHLVPLFARGGGADLALRLATETDPLQGPYLDDTDVFVMMREVFGVD